MINIKISMLKNERFWIGTTRFNNKTFNENKDWRAKHEWKGCIYGVDKYMSTHPKASPPNGLIYVLEMNFGNQIIIDKPFILTLSYVVIFPGLASFFFWIKGIGIIGANRAGVFLHLMPVFGSIMAIILFNEKFMFYHIWGAIFIIAGITLSNKKN